MKEQMLLWSELKPEQIDLLQRLGIDERYYYVWYFSDFHHNILNQRIKRMLITHGIIKIMI